MLYILVKTDMPIDSLLSGLSGADHSRCSRVFRILRVWSWVFGQSRWSVDGPVAILDRRYQPSGYYAICRIESSVYDPKIER